MIYTSSLHPPALHTRTTNTGLSLYPNTSQWETNSFGLFMCLYSRGHVSEQIRQSMCFHMTGGWIIVRRNRLKNL